MESDSITAIKLVTFEYDNFHPYAFLVNQFFAFGSREWDIQFEYVYREANQVEDFLVRLAHPLPMGTHCFEAPHPSCRSSLFYDCTATVFPRSVVV